MDDVSVIHVHSLKSIARNVSLTYAEIKACSTLRLTPLIIDSNDHLMWDHGGLFRNDG